MNKKYSQSGQDAFVLSYFNNKRNGVFIDIGANDGETFSNSRQLILDGWNAVLVEPSPKAFAKLNKLEPQ